MVNLTSYEVMSKSTLFVCQSCNTSNAKSPDQPFDEVLLCDRFLNLYQAWSRRYLQSSTLLQAPKPGFKIRDRLKIQQGFTESFKLFQGESVDARSQFLWHFSNSSGEEA